MIDPHNPFLISGYAGPEYFCDREREAASLTEAIINNRNVTLFSARRMGKSALLQHIFHQLRTKKNYNSVYFDILSTQNIPDFTEAFAKAVIKTFGNSKKNILRRMKDFLQSIGAVVKFDPVSGEPSFQFSWIELPEAKRSLENVFAYLESQNKPVVIAIDEFQQITNYPEGNAEAILRTLIQQTQNLRFIFSGSHKHMLTSIFSDYGRPFYQSTQFMELGPINQAAYIDFIQKKFTKSRRKISEKAVLDILTWCRHHTYYVQYVCNRLYSKEIKTIETFLPEIKEEVYMENEPIFYSYKNLLTAIQWKVLAAVAKEDGLATPHASGFISRHNLGAPSSISRALQALVDKEMVLYTDEKYYVYNVFLARWLQERW